jgi:ABC-2 type transport system ATP-binding protein
MKNDAVVQVQRLRKVYDTQVAVDDLSFEVEAGEVMGFVGPNGAGKTTTLRVISGILPPTSGRVRVGGAEMGTDPLKAKRHLGFVPDTPHLFEHLTVGEHLQFVGRVHNLPDTESRAARILESLQILDRRDHLPESLSRGMQQKVAIAWAFLHDPVAILMDEPLSGLDPRGIRTVKDAIRKRADEGAAVIISSHLLELVEAMCDSILIISEGKALARGPIADLKERLKGDASLEEVFFQVTEGGS